MKGMVTPIVLWSLALAPLAFATLRLSRRAFLWSAIAITGGSLCACVAGAAFGWRLAENQTSSLDGHLYAYRIGAPFAKGELVAYRWRGGASYPAGTLFIKRAAGVPGDMVVRHGDAFWIDQHYIGIAKPRSRAGAALSPAAGGPIPQGQYFMAAPSPDSLDSRYALGGNVKQSDIVGKAYELF